jgi:hypothetical protein
MTDEKQESTGKQARAAKGKPKRHRPCRPSILPLLSFRSIHLPWFNWE